MIKSIVIATVASIVSFNAMAADSSHCNSLDGAQGSFNKTELTAFDKCWLDTHKTDTAGVHGSIFYVKTGDSYTSMTVKSVAESSSSEAGRVEFVMNAVVDGVAQSVVDALEAEKTQLMQDVIAGEVALEEAQKMIEAKQAIIDAFDVTSDNAAAIQAFKDGIAVTTDAVDASYTAVGVDTKTFAPAAEAWANVLDNDNVATNLVNLTGWGTENAHLDNVIDYFGTAGFTVLGEQTQLAIQTAVSEAIQFGYDQGYDAGYADGYAAGFADGVASVK